MSQENVYGIVISRIIQNKKFPFNIFINPILGTQDIWIDINLAQRDLHEVLC
jgi:hypothetical protein